MSNKNTEKLRADILALLEKDASLSVQQAVATLHVSESTVRRAFAKLEAGREVIRVYGGIRLAARTNSYEYDEYYNKEREAKTRIGCYAANLVQDNDYLFVDCGTTTIHMCEHLVERIKKKELSGITVVTNSLVNLEILHAYCRTFQIGGVYLPKRRSFAGSLSESFLGTLHFDTSFLGADALTLDGGFSTSNFDCSRLSDAAAAAADRTLVLIDSTKIGRRSFVVYDRFEHITGIITDERISDDAVLQLQKKSLAVYTAH